MRILVIGATGLLGRVLLEEWHGEDIVRGVGAHDLDIRNRAQLETYFAEFKPHWTLLLAAYTDVDGCEQNLQLAREVNYVGAINVALAARQAGSRLLFVSTDYVFDGKKKTPYETGDETCPINNYGCLKAEAEKSIREILPECCIVRTSWLFGANGRCFPNTILALASRQKKLRVVSDQFGSPTYNRDLARAMVKLVGAEARGVIHARNEGECSWHDFAREVLQAANCSEVTIEAIRTEDFPRPAARPKYSVLSIASLTDYGIRMRPWTETLRDYFTDRDKEKSSMAQTSPGEVTGAAPTRSKERS